MSHEFSDESLDIVEYKSCWKKERSVNEEFCQTKEIYSESIGSQSYATENQEVQTDLNGGSEYFRLADSDNKDLADFLQSVEPMVMKCLANNVKSRAFDGLTQQQEDKTDSITCVHTLHNAELKQELQITGLSWNATGSTIAATYGRFDHEDWCTHRASLSTWNLDRRSVKEDRPDTIIDSPCCLMCLEFHPTNPAWLVGGNFNGEVIVWDLSREDDLVIASSGIGNDAHREPVSKVHWVKGQSSKRKDYNIVSVSGDGKVLVWKVDLKKGKLKLSSGFVVMSQSLPRAMKVRGVRGDKEVGVTSLSFSHDDPDLYVLGSESGCVFKCNMQATGSPAGSHIVSSVPLCSPVTFTYQPHHGPVHSVDCSGFHRNAFLSAGMDQSIRIYNMLQTAPVLTIEPDDGYLYSAKWSPVRASVLACVTEKGHLLLYDLRQGQMVPELKVEASPNKVPVYSLQFNPHQKKILATGDGEGYIRVFRLASSLTSMSGRDLEVLEEIVSTGTE